MHSQWVDFINSKVPGAGATLKSAEVGDSSITVEAAKILPVCQALKTGETQFNVLQVITGCDFGEFIEVSYVLASYTLNTELILKVKLAKPSSEAEVELDSVVSVWKAANFQERECYDMMGVRFSGHPDFRRILCPEDWVGFPLRRDYVVQKEWQGIPINPEHKNNTYDQDFGARLQSEFEDPKQVSLSWKTEFGN